MIYFAWVESPGTGGAEFGPEHLVQDENIVRFAIEHNEGDFAKLAIDVENPRIGPLAAGRPIWAWLSWEEGTAAVPLFFGRLIGVPSGIIGNVITYDFVARPSDYAELKAALANTMRVLPFYDELFIDPARREDPDVVWEGYSEIWHIDRVTHEVTSSDFLVGDEVVEYSGPSVIYDSVELTLDRPPLTSVTVNGEVPWTQHLNGTIDLGSKTFASVADADAWPKAGDSLAGGYRVISSSASQAKKHIEPYSINFSWHNEAKKHRDGDTMSLSESKTDIDDGSASRFLISTMSRTVVGDKYTGTPGSGSYEETGLAVSFGVFTGSLTLGVETGSDRKEAVSVIVTSDLQPVLRDPEDTSDTETIDLGSTDVGDECDGEAAIVDPSRGEYVTTARGLQSVQYMIARARARLLIGARVVQVKWECPFADAVNLSCRKNAQIFDPRIPGGEALGKIVSYSLRGDGTTGEFRGAVTIACAVGFGNAISELPGTADYVDESYVDDYQTFTGQVIALPSGDIGYSPPILVDGGGGIIGPITKARCVLRDEIVSLSEDVEGELVAVAGPPLTDASSVLAHIEAQRRAQTEKFAQVLAEKQTWREIELLDLTQQGIEAKWQVSTTPLVVPMQIDLTSSITA